MICLRCFSFISFDAWLDCCFTVLFISVSHEEDVIVIALDQLVEGIFICKSEYIG